MAWRHRARVIVGPGAGFSRRTSTAPTISSSGTHSRFGTTPAACFADNSVKPEIAKSARVFVGIFSVLFAVAEAMELMS